MMDDDRLARLTTRQRECLRLLYAHYKPGEIATRLGISTDRVNQHLKAARDRLGVTRSIDAARILTEAEGGPSPSMGAPVVGVSPPAPAPDEGLSSDARAGGGAAELNERRMPYDAGAVDGWSAPFLPVPTAARPFNELRWYQKIGWAFAIGLGATAFAGAMITLQNAIR